MLKPIASAAAIVTFAEIAYAVLVPMLRAAPCLTLTALTAAAAAMVGLTAVAIYRK